MRKNIYLVLTISIISVLPSSFLKAQAHCKLGWQMTPYFCDMDSMILTAYAFGGAEPYSYLWSTGETTVSILVPNNSQSTYSVTITGVTGCTAEGTITLGVDLNPYINGSTIGCENFPIQLQATLPFLVTAPPGMTYLWSTGQTTPSIMATTTGTYSVTFTDPANGCIYVASEFINFLPAPDPVIQGPTQLCGNQSITLTATGGPFLNYYWIPGGNETQSLTVNTPGTYIVQVQGSNFCYGYDTIQITQGNALSLDGTVSNYTSCSNANGAVDLTITPNGSYTYEWSNGASTQDITNLLPGVYTVTVSANGCELTSSFTIEDQTITPIITLNQVAASCGLSNGEVSATVNPTGSYTYQWSNGASTQDLMNVPTGQYTVTVTSANGCSSVSTIQVGNNQSTPVITGTTQPNSSCAAANGSIDVNISGVSNYTLSWSNGATTEDLLNIPAGAYTITVTEGNTCTGTATFVVESVTNEPEIQFTITPSVCGEANGQVEVLVNGGTAPYTFAWSNGSNASQLNNLFAGNYQLTVTGANGCTASSNAEIVDQLIDIQLSGLTVNNSSCNGSNGEIDLVVNPGGNYTYQWSNGNTTEDLQQLAAGVYSITVTTGITCIETESFTIINENLPFTVTGATTDHTSCLQQNGSIDLSVTPSGNYTYEWSNGLVTEDLQQLSGGNYMVTVTNSDGCIIVASFNVNSNFPLITISSVMTLDTSCTSPSGGIDITVNPTGTYLFAWSNGSMTEDLINVGSGVYALTVTDANGCTASSSAQVTGNSVYPVLQSLILPEICGQSNGSIELTSSPSGNSYAWSTGSTSSTISGLKSGQYFVTVTTLSGCFIVDSFFVAIQDIPFTINEIVQDDNSCLYDNGKIDVEVLPTDTYSYSWSNGLLDKNLDSLSAGSYYLTVTNPTGCARVDTFIISDLTAEPVITSTITPATCNLSNGSIDLSITTGGLVQFAWSTGAVTEDLNNLVSGDYTVTVTDSNGCFVVETFNVPDQSSSFQITGSTTDNHSCITPEGAIYLTINQPGQYQFNWSNGSLNDTITGLSPGTYIVTVTNEAGCNAMDSFQIQESISFPELSATLVPETCGQNNGAIDLTITGGSNNQIVWSNGDITEDLTQIAQGQYHVIVMSEFGCQMEMDIEVQNLNSNFTATAQTYNDTSCIAETGAIDLFLQPSDNYTYQWSNGKITEDLLALVAGTYTVTITDPLNCSSVETFTIDDITVKPEVSSVIEPETCGSFNGRITLTVTPSAGNHFEWSTGETSSEIENLPAGTYSVTVTNEAYCEVDKIFTVPGNAKLDIDLTADLSSVAQGGNVTCELDINLPLAAIDVITWTPDEIMSCHETLCLTQEFLLTEKTEISVMVMDTFGCIEERSISLDIEPGAKVFIPNIFSPNGDGANDGFTIHTNEEVEEVVRLEIFDRWGDEVFVNSHFQPNDDSLGWNGEYKGQDMNPAVFVYMAVIKLRNGEERNYRGDVTLVR